MFFTQRKQFYPNPQGGTPPPHHFDVGKIGVGAPSEGCSRTVEGRLQMKVDRPPFSGTCFGICSRQVLGEFSAPLGWKNKAVAGHNAPAVGSGWRPLGTKSHQNPTKNGAQSRAKTMQNQNRRKIVLKSPPRASFWSDILVFGIPLSSILEPKTRQRGFQKASKNSINF